MQTILNDLEMLGGVQHSCVIYQDQVHASTFPGILNDNLTGIAKVIMQIFGGVEGMQRNHREIHVELEENLLIGYRLENGAILALLTDKAINLALIKTSVRSATQKLLEQLDTPDHSAPTPVAPTPETDATADAINMDEEALSVHLETLKLLLAEYIGPAARVVFGRANNSWRAAGEPLPQLCERLAEFIDNESKRADFLRRANSSLPK